MSRRLTSLILGVAFFTAACTSGGLPSSYEDQDRRAEKQFVASCESREDGNDPDFCQCAFYTVAQEMTFTEFLDLDDRLKDDPESLTLEDRQLIEGVSLPCRYSADDISN
ncbi:MAG: hypothetical protein ACI81L_000750 [Verrucomicrobiales bacterium]|jgi:hypothetical protein